MGFDYRAFSSISSAARCSTPAALRLSFAYVLSGGLLEFSSDHAGGITIVFSGGTADHLKVSSGGTLDVLGTVTSNVDVFAGGTVNVSSGGVVSGGPSSGTAVSGTLNVLSGGSDAFNAISGGGQVVVSAGGIASTSERN